MHQVKDKNADLHGNVPESSPVALLLIDVINDMDFDGAEALVTQAEAMAPRIAELKQRAREARIPAVYINDNFGRWQSDFSKAGRALPQRRRAGRRRSPGMLRPADDDYFVLKPKHSAFFETTLDTLLAYLGATTLILTGVAGNICILFSANDAYMRDYNIIVPSDCVVSNTRRENDNALDQIERVLKGTVTPSDQLDLAALVAGAHRRR